MRALDVIVKKRNGGTLTEQEIRFLLAGYVSGDIPEYQVSAWLMAVFFRGMTPEETAHLTREMIGSGDTIDLSDLTGPFVDKHSTGGVGDKVSLILAPLVACFGIKIPMMSGRSLGHTGGTLDKLESIPGYTIARNTAEFRRILAEVGYAMTGQSEKIVPADRLLYALRDVTGTVESIPLITASILSKKFAEGADALVFDVKCGDGAFMKSREEAQKLAHSLVNTGVSLGKRIVAVITNMDEPLGNMVGNFLEAEESALCLKGEGPADLMDLTVRLSGWMLVAAGRATDIEEGVLLCTQKLATGEPWDRFLANIKSQHGDPAAFQNSFGKARAPVQTTITAERSGYVGAIHAYSVGMAAVLLGAGRSKADDSVFPYVGIELKKKRGDSVSRGDELCTLFAETPQSMAAAVPLLRKAYSITEAAPASQQMIIEEISAL